MYEPVKTTHRFILGLLSSLFLAVGLAHAAQNLDPLKSARAPSPAEVRGFSPACLLPCDFPVPQH